MKKKCNKFVFSYILLLGNLLILNCAPIVFSPHAQNEMVTPYNRMGGAHEIGGALSLNKWMINQDEDTIYIRTYPSTSLSFFQNLYYSQGKFGRFGGFELIFLPTQLWVSEVSGFMLWLKPYLGFQYNKIPITCRLNFLPIDLGVSYGNGEFDIGWGLNEISFYQLTILLHNNQPSKHIYWGGIRNSPIALGFVAGYEYSLDIHHSLRIEYSYLRPPPFSLLLSESELETFIGSVHYITIGFFKRLK